MTARAFVIWITLLLPGRLFAQNVSEVQVAPPTVTVKVGERSGLLATAFDRAGNVIPTVRFIWSSNNVSVARGDNDGTVTGVGGGVAIVEARVGARKGQAAIQVIGAPAAGGQTNAQAQSPARPAEPPGGVDPFAGQPPGTGPAAVLRIEPPTVYLLPSENTRVVPRALKDDGSPAAPVAVTWKSLRPDIASVDQNGVIVALAAGQGTVQVTSSTGLTATAPVVVQPSDIAIQEPRAGGPDPLDRGRHVASELRPGERDPNRKEGRQDHLDGQGSRAGARCDVADSRHRRRPQAVGDAARPAAQQAICAACQLRRRNRGRDRPRDGGDVRFRQPAGRRRRGGRHRHRGGVRSRAHHRLGAGG